MTRTDCTTATPEMSIGTRWRIVWVCIVGAAVQTAAGQQDGGACCRCAEGTASCVETPEADCAAEGGIFLGAGSPCEPLVVRSSSPYLLVDSNLPAAIDTIVVQESFKIDDIEVFVAIDHTYVGDLCVMLEKDGMEVSLIKRIGGALDCGGSGCCGCPSDHLAATLDDDALQTIEDQCFWEGALSGAYRPEEHLNLFKGTFANGTWTLTVMDSARGDMGALVSWSLLLTPYKIDSACRAAFPEGCQCSAAGDCDDGDPCTTDSCDPLGACTHTPLECSSGMHCDLGGCVEDPECVADADCDDGEGCTADHCDPALGCVHEQLECPPGTVCSDGRCAPLADPVIQQQRVALEGLDRPCRLTLVYTGERCDAGDHQQDRKKVACTGDPEFAETVYVVAGKDKKPKRDKAWFEGLVTLNQPFTLQAASAGKDKLDKKLYLHVFDAAGEVLLQTVMFEVHPKDKSPLSIGDRFGSMMVDDYVPDGECTIGAND